MANKQPLRIYPRYALLLPRSKIVRLPTQYSQYRELPNRCLQDKTRGLTASGCLSTHLQILLHPELSECLPDSKYSQMPVGKSAVLSFAKEGSRCFGLPGNPTVRCTRHPAARLEPSFQIADSRSVLHNNFHRQQTGSHQRFQRQISTAGLCCSGSLGSR